MLARWTEWNSVLLWRGTEWNSVLRERWIVSGGGSLFAGCVAAWNSLAAEGSTGGRELVVFSPLLVVDAEAASAERLAAAIRTELAAPSVRHEIDLDGAGRTREILEGL
ncbi:MAG TPA: hypothetical protein VML55_22490 [Planctomycetaceae bacterium]|nr:hypothetical protein [Planctomycetaceae bacterium]